ncbi:thioredoxin [Salmonella enterica]|nr:thioredoxin [Salmonella enterica]
MHKQIIFFKGSNCTPCKMVEPAMERIKEKYKGTVQYVRAVDDNVWMANFGIRSVPAVVVIDGDKEPTILLGKDITTAKIEALIS